MGKKSKKKKQAGGPPPEGSQRVGKAARRRTLLIYGIVAFVVIAWLGVFIGFLIRWFGVGGPTPAP